MAGKLTPSGIGMFAGVLVEACLVDEAIDRLLALLASLLLPLLMLGLKGALLRGFIPDEFELIFDEEFVFLFGTSRESVAMDGKNNLDNGCTCFSVDL